MRDHMGHLSELHELVRHAAQVPNRGNQYKDNQHRGANVGVSFLVEASEALRNEFVKFDQNPKVSSTKEFVKFVKFVV